MSETVEPQPKEAKPKQTWNEYRIMRCQKCGAFIGNGGWIPFGKCKQCEEPW